MAFQGPLNDLYVSCQVYLGNGFTCECVMWGENWRLLDLGSACCLKIISKTQRKEISGTNFWF